MPRILAIAVVVGVISGLLVGGFHNIFTAPVIERSIALEEERAAAKARDLGMAMEEEKPLVSLGVQRVGMAIGTGIYGGILGLAFAGGYALMRRVAPGWQPLALALMVGALGFWAVFLFPFIKYPLNPPGVGDPQTLTFRQGYQALFIFLSAVGMVGVLLGLRRVNLLTSSWSQRRQLYGLIALAYAAFGAVIFLVLPANPDPVPVPIDLLQLFRTFTVIGHFLLWTLLAVGVALTIMWYERSAQKGRSPATARGATRGMPANP